ncbi:MAG: 50S ribosomal protein L1 [Candidatus Gracilibacteria bacterium]|nr:50S ribosomal protein L1 [Candidatus Gracilibacteria bacterium]MDD3120349.1 50S ribosomal protein L1 [Candidatus Gracilibacteria bacterium]MDD4530351.1 50S ribosomal protein L1 [Candidatus Gracilibacteria bacterium]
MKRGKKYNQVAPLVNKDMTYSVAEAIELAIKTNTVKFDATVEIHFNLNIDPKQADQGVRSSITLPNGTGKVTRIAAFSDAGDEKALLAIGAVIAGGEDLMEEVLKGKTDFDIAVATTAMMRKMGKVAKVLGPKGLMPSPKAGTVSDDLQATIKEIVAGRFEFKNDKQGNVHSIVGKVSFGKEKLVQNLEYFISALKEARPAGAKGNFIDSVYICNTMGPGIKLDVK